MSEKRCYTVQELQEILGVSRPTIYNLLKKKELMYRMSHHIILDHMLTQWLLQKKQKIVQNYLNV